MNLGCIDRTLERGETSRDLPRRETSSSIAQFT
jgi:hypothetical protein